MVCGVVEESIGESEALVGGAGTGVCNGAVVLELSVGSGIWREVDVPGTRAMGPRSCLRVEVSLRRRGSAMCLAQR